MHLNWNSGDEPLCTNDSGKLPVNGRGDGIASLTSGLAIHYIRHQAHDLLHPRGQEYNGTYIKRSICTACYTHPTTKRWLTLIAMGGMYE